MKNNKKKGFTLVELLVVIAIIAILATVSVVGYLGFTKKANQSKCLSEATQVREVINGTLLDGKELKVGNYSAQLVNGVLKVSTTDTSNPLTGDALDKALVELFKDLKGLDADTNAQFTLDDKGLFTYTTAGHKATITFDGNPIATPVEVK